MISKKESKAENQIAKFRQAARDLETDENEAVFDEKLGRIARHKPSKAAPKED